MFLQVITISRFSTLGMSDNTHSGKPLFNFLCPYFSQYFFPIAHPPPCLIPEFLYLLNIQVSDALNLMVARIITHPILCRKSIPPAFSSSPSPIQPFH